MGKKNETAAEGLAAVAEAPARAPDATEMVRRDLVVPFTAEERLEVGEEMASSLRRARDIDAQRAAQNSALNGQIKEHMEEARRLADDYARGGRLGPVEVSRRVYYEEDVVVEVRQDTGEVVSVRGLRPNERQMGLKSLDGGEEAEGGEVVAFPGDDGPGAPSRPEVPR